MRRHFRGDVAHRFRAAHRHEQFQRLRRSECLVTLPALVRRVNFSIVRVTLIDRFIAREVFTFAVMSTATLSFVLVLGNVFREVCELLLNHRIPLESILEFVACAIPFCLTYTLPWGFLTALFLVFGRMAADRELLVLQTNGVPIGRACRWVFLIGLAFSLLCFWINAEVNPRARQRMKVILHDLAISTLLNDTGSNRFVHLPNRVLYIGAQDSGKLRNVQIYEYDEESQLERTVMAQNGWLESLEEKDELVLHLDGVISDERGGDNDDEESVSTFHESISAQQFAYSISYFDLLRKYSSTNFKSLGSRTLGELNESLMHDDTDPTMYSIFLTEFNKRISLSLACLTFTFIGVPIAILFHRKETTIGFGLGLIVACSYFVFYMVADNCRDNPAVRPQVLMWLANAVFIPLGGALFRHLARR
jgi:lipopolysaccharide export system permease protein